MTTVNYDQIPVAINFLQDTLSHYVEYLQSCQKEIASASPENLHYILKAHHRIPLWSQLVQRLKGFERILFFCKDAQEVEGQLTLIAKGKDWGEEYSAETMLRTFERVCDIVGFNYLPFKLRG